MKNIEKAEKLYNHISADLPSNFNLFIVYGNMNLECDQDYHIEKHIIQLKCHDDYHHLSVKTMKMIHCIYEMFPTIKGIFKCDDDIEINMNKFHSFLDKNITLLNHDYIGKQTYTTGGKGSKGYNTLRGKYCGGPLYFLSIRAIEALYSQKKTWSYYEDNCIGYNLSKKNIHPYNYPLYTDSPKTFLNSKTLFALHNKNIPSQKGGIIGNVEAKRFKSIQRRPNFFL